MTKWSASMLNSWRCDSLLEVRVIIEDWRGDYNANRSHSAHGELTPAEFALQWTTTHQPPVASTCLDHQTGPPHPHYPRFLLFRNAGVRVANALRQM